jgi:23S rRNA (uracil1939-C5)-methyltransferase
MLETFELSQEPELIIIDPPRAGLSKQIKSLLPYLPKHDLIYVSCNPSTCKRDLEELCKHGYQIRSLQGIDMFPHTLHCEMIAHLSK